MKPASRIIGRDLPSLEIPYQQRLLGRATLISQDSSRPAHDLFEPLPSSRRFRSTKTMTYGAETWALTSQIKNMLAAAQTRMGRSMLYITYLDRKTNIWVKEKTKVTVMIKDVRRRMLTWAGPLNRTRDNHVSPHGNPTRRETI